MSRLEVTEKIIATKVAKGIKWADVAKDIAGDKDAWIRLLASLSESLRAAELASQAAERAFQLQLSNLNNVQQVFDTSIDKAWAGLAAEEERMIALADEYGFRVGSPREDARRGGTVVLDVPHAEAVCERLLASDVLLDVRPGVGLRLAPHLYTRDDEVDLVMRRVRDEVRRAGG